MANLNKQLKPLFDAYLKRLADERTRPTVRSGANNYREGSLFNGHREFTGVIYFYEWSDVSRQPKTFYTMEKFEDFLESCNICMMGYQREIINNMHNPYITCKKGTKELIIKVTYDALKSAVTIPSPTDNFMAKGSEDKVPYQVAVTRPPIQRPPMYEPEGRWQDENEFQWYG
jgi:hypothetical protein